MFNTLAFIPFIVAAMTTPTALASEVSGDAIFHVINDTDIVLDVPYVNQKDDLVGTADEWAGGSACGPASITMVLNYLGKSFDLQTVANALPTNVYVKGRMFYNLADGPKYFGFTSQDIEIDTIEIHEILSKGYPIIMNIQNYDGITGHAVVVVGIKGFNGITAEALIVHDPFRAPYRLFKYINEQTLQQPEGYITPIGILKPFYVTNYSLASAVAVE
jgi:hypothetical protein